jgi:beta-alanine degradation protein BauB
MIKSKFNFIAIGICALMILSFGVNTARAQDLAKLRPDMQKVLLENDSVRVIEWTLKPGEKEPVHTHPEMVTYILTGGKRAAYGADGKLINEAEPKAGRAFWSGPMKHYLVNTGTTEIKAILVEIKTNPYKE